MFRDCIAIFLKVFALMLIDIRPPSKCILPLFLFGTIGTSVQNILRLFLLLAANYPLRYGGHMAGA